MASTNTLNSASFYHFSIAQYLLKTILAFVFFLLPTSISIAKIKSLHSNWIFCQQGKNSWYKATVPGTVHTDLLQNKIIQDPFIADHLENTQWVQQSSWIYKTSFILCEEEYTSQYALLVFEGLDTYASVYLNGQLILEANNMFRTYKPDVSNKLKQTNEIVIIFHPVLALADSLAKLDKIKRPCENNRHYIRKAQYHFGWDWAPEILTMGIWRPINLYLNESPKTNETKTQNIALIREKDSIGESFYFTINHKPSYIIGANWVPADVFLPRITRNKYRQLLVAAKEAGIQMLRVWGGGIYEQNDFYELCDSLGLLVWQDFMFAGAMYPADSQFLSNVEAELRDNITRLRAYQCIVLWCGNNEIDEAWHNWGWQKQFNLSPADSATLWKDYQYLFHQKIPDLLNELDPQRPYVTTSPIYGWGREQSMTDGDSHYWGVWWGLQPKEVFCDKVPRFMSEMGMQAMPNFESIQQFVPTSQQFLFSTVLLSHQKHPTGFETIDHYLKQEKMSYTDIKSYIQATQTLQAKVLHTALQAQYYSQGRCMGSLWWQWNDCWPVCSWSIVDYYGNAKRSYRTLKQFTSCIQPRK